MVEVDTLGLVVGTMTGLLMSAMPTTAATALLAANTAASACRNPLSRSHASIFHEPSPVYYAVVAVAVVENIAVVDVG